MLAKTVTYTDYNGETQTETCLFNMTRVEIATMQVKMDGMYIDYLQDLVAKRKIEKLFGFIKDFVLDSYGEKSADGRKFVKSAEIRADFENSLAYEQVLMETIESPESMRAFVLGVIPSDMAKATGEIDAKAIASIT